MWSTSLSTDAVELSGPGQGPDRDPREPPPAFAEGAVLPPVPAAVPVAGTTSDLPEFPGVPGVPGPRGRRRRRTALLLASALLLGVLGGGGVGYAVQASRPPTPLPSLDVAPPHYPAEPLDAKGSAAAAPEPLAIDGDLRKLLIKKPKNAKSWDFLPGRDGWMPADQMAQMLDNTSDVFRSLLVLGFRRAAMTSWLEGDTDIRIRLIQFRPEHTEGAAGTVQAAAYCSQHNDDPCTPRSIPGTATGHAYVTRRSFQYSDSTERYYYGLAVACRGDVVMRIDVHSPKRVDLQRIVELAERQWRRL